jgi:hypothetical protein
LAVSGEAAVADVAVMPAKVLKGPSAQELSDCWKSLKTIFIDDRDSFDTHLHDFLSKYLENKDGHEHIKRLVIALLVRRTQAYMAYFTDFGFNEMMNDVAGSFDVKDLKGYGDFGKFVTDLVMKRFTLEMFRDEKAFINMYHYLFAKEKAGWKKDPIARDFLSLEDRRDVFESIRKLFVQDGHPGLPSPESDEVGKSADKRREKSGTERGKKKRSRDLEDDAI